MLVFLSYVSLTMGTKLIPYWENLITLDTLIWNFPNVISQMTFRINTPKESIFTFTTPIRDMVFPVCALTRLNRWPFTIKTIIYMYWYWLSNHCTVHTIKWLLSMSSDGLQVNLYMEKLYCTGCIDKVWSFFSWCWW